MGWPLPHHHQEPDVNNNTEHISGRASTVDAQPVDGLGSIFTDEITFHLKLMGLFLTW